MEIEGFIDELKLTTTIVLVMHNVLQAAGCADQMASFYLGELLEAGTPLPMFTNPRQVRTHHYITGRFG